MKSRLPIKTASKCSTIFLKQIWCTGGGAPEWNSSSKRPLGRSASSCRPLQEKKWWAGILVLYYKNKASIDLSIGRFASALFIHRQVKRCSGQPLPHRLLYYFLYLCFMKNIVWRSPQDIFDKPIYLFYRFNLVDLCFILFPFSSSPNRLTDLMFALIEKWLHLSGQDWHGGGWVSLVLSSIFGRYVSP